MPITISPPANRARQVRKLQRRGLAPEEIHQLTGFELGFVDQALSAQSRRRVRNTAAVRVEARGPLTASQIADKTGMPLAAAKLMVK